MADNKELKNKIEAILYASGKGVGLEDLCIYCDTKPKQVDKALQELQKEFEEREGSLVFSEVNGRWKLTVRGKYTMDIQKIVSETELPNPILKTLAVVAYKSPVLQSDVVNMRGQTAYEHIKELVKQKFITKEEKGRSYILKITDKFYNYFDVEGDEEIREVFAKLRAQQEQLEGLEIVDSASTDDEEATGDGNTPSDGAQKKRGELDIVEMEDATPRTRQRSDEEKKEEEEFLARMDTNIGEMSEKISSHEIAKPVRYDNDENEESEGIKESGENAEDEETPSDEQITETTSKEKEDDPLKKMEEYAKQEEEKEKEDFL